MRTLVLGGSGLLGSHLVDRLRLPRPIRVDITNADALGDELAGAEIIINCAGWTDVDSAEMQEDAAARVNILAVHDLAHACADIGAWLFHISTDHVFAGDSTAPANEAEPIRPINAYGRTKAAGEAAVLMYERGVIIRTAWLYGRKPSGFVRSVIEFGRQGVPFDVVDDQQGHPTFADDAAQRIHDIVTAVSRGQVPAGIWHAVNTGSTSRWHLAKRVLSLVGGDPGLALPISTRPSPRTAPRPRLSILADERAERFGLTPMRGWWDALTSARPTLIGS